MIWSVKFSHHFHAWDAGRPDRTVKTEFNRRTHCFVQSVKSVFVRNMPISDSNSLKILRKLGCTLDQFGIEKESPIAAPGVWYGSCPRITILVSSNEVSCSALNILSALGKHSYCEYSQLIKVCNQ